MPDPLGKIPTLVTPQATLAVCLLTMLLIVGIWDIYAYARNDPAATVSNIIGDWAKAFPILGIAIGVLVGHLFWPRQPR